MIQGYNIGNLGAEEAYNFFNRQADNEASNYQAQDLFTFGDTYHNRMADRNAQKASEAFNAWQAQLQRDYEERMDNTKYSRAAKDLASIGFFPFSPSLQLTFVCPFRFGRLLFGRIQNPR